jgi:hypothetical protein
VLDGHVALGDRVAMAPVRAGDVIIAPQRLAHAHGDAFFADVEMRQAGHLGSRLIVILNDNGMSISPTVGALARLLDRVRFDHRYRIGKEKSRGSPGQKGSHSKVRRPGGRLFCPHDNSHRPGHLLCLDILN